MFTLLNVLSRAEKINFVGAPYHGVVVDGTLDLTGSGGPSLAMAIPDTSWNVALSNPNRTLPTRTAGEQVTDAAAGKEYRAYGLAPGRRVFGISAAALGFDQLVYFDSRGYTWLVTLDLSITLASGTMTGSALFERFLHVGALASPTSVNETGLSFSAGSFDADLVGATRSMLVLDQLPDGSKCLLGASVDPTDAQIGFWELTISDTVTETGGDYPYGGGTIEFNLSLTTVRANSAMVGAVTYTDDNNVHVQDRNGNDPPVFPYADDNFKDSPTGDASSGYTRAFSVSDRYIWANYNTAGGVVEWSYDFSGTSLDLYTFVAGGVDGVHTQTATRTETVTFALKKGGTVQDTKTFTMNRNYFAERDDTAIGDDDLNSYGYWTSEVTFTATGFTNEVGSVRYPVTGSVNGAGWVKDFQLNANSSIVIRVHGLFAFESAGQIVVGGAGKTSKTFLPNYSNLNNEDAQAFFWEFDDGDFSNGGVGLCHAFRLENYVGNKTLTINVYRMETGNNGDYVNSGDTTYSYDQVRLGTVFAPDSSQVPDTTVRTVGARVDYPPVAYDPENDAWSVGAWKAGSSEWEVRHYV